MPHEVANTIKLLPVYGVDHYGTDVFLPLLETGLTEQTVDISAGAITGSADGTNPPIDKTDILYSDTPTMQLLHAGDDTTFDHTWRWRPDMSAIVYKTEILLGIGLNVSAFTSGSIDLSTLIVTLSEVGQAEVLFTNTFDITMTAKTDATPAWFIFHADVVEPFKVFSSTPIDFRLQIAAASETGVSVTQTGLLPIFPYTTADILKPFTPSGLTFHIHASLDHADPIFNRDIGRII